MADSIDLSPPIDAHALARALNSLLMGFQVIGFDWRYLYLNPAAARHGRSTPGALVGRTMWEAYPGIERQEPLMSLLRRAMTERSSHVLENEFESPDGTRRWFLVRIEPVSEGICVYSIDIHDRKEQELALARRLARTEGQLRPPLLRRVWQSLTGKGRRRRTAPRIAKL